MKAKASKKQKSAKKPKVKAKAKAASRPKAKAKATAKRAPVRQPILRERQAARAAAAVSSPTPASSVPRGAVVTKNGERVDTSKPVTVVEGDELAVVGAPLSDVEIADMEAAEPEVEEPEFDEESEEEEDDPDNVY